MRQLKTINISAMDTLILLYQPVKGGGGGSGGGGGLAGRKGRGEGGEWSHGGLGCEVEAFVMGSDEGTGVVVPAFLLRFFF